MSQLVSRDKKIQSIRELLTRDSIKAQLAMVAPRHLSPDRITRIAMTSIQRTPKLLDCTPESLLGSLLTCTQLGLEPDSVSGRAYLIPYKTTCTLIIGYRGLMELARRSGEIRSLEARVVRKGDGFDYEYGAHPKLVHKPAGATVEITHAYAVAHIKNSDIPQFEVMSRDEIDGIRKRSKAAQDGPWVTDFSEMARKTVMRRLCKYLPSSPELSQAVTLDEQAERGIPQEIDFVDVEVSKPTGDNTKPETLDDVVKKEQAPVVEPTPEPKAIGTIGRKSDLYRRIHQAFMPLKDTRKEELRKQFGFKLITDVGLFTESNATDLMSELEPVEKE